MLHLDGCRDHKLQKGKGNFRSGQRGSRCIVIIRRRDFNDIASNQLKTVQTVQNSKKLARGPSTCFRRSRGCIC